MSEEKKRHLSEMWKGRKLPPEHCQNISNGMIGRKPTDATRVKLSDGKIGDRNPMFGTISPTRKVFIAEAELRDMFIANGMTIRAIAEQLKVSKSAVSKQLRRYDIRLTPEQCGDRVRGIKNALYKDGSKPVLGYIRRVTKGHPNARSGGYVLEHRLAIEKVIGRALLPAEQVHHLNYQVKDNWLENLILFHTGSDHTKFHKWLERAGAFSLGILDKPPAPLIYSSPVLVRGRWVNEISVSSFWVTGIEAVA